MSDALLLVALVGGWILLLVSGYGVLNVVLWLVMGQRARRDARRRNHVSRRKGSR